MRIKLERSDWQYFGALVLLSVALKFSGMDDVDFHMVLWGAGALAWIAGRSGKGSSRLASIKKIFRNIALANFLLFAISFLLVEDHWITATSFVLHLILGVAGFFLAIVRIFVGDFGALSASEKLPPDRQSPEAVRKRIAEIGNNFKSFQDILKREEKGIAVAMKQMQESLDAQSKEFATVEKELQQARDEAKHYRDIADLTKEQQALFLALIRRDKAKDYVVGFALGIVASLMATGLWQIVSTGFLQKATGP